MILLIIRLFVKVNNKHINKILFFLFRIFSEKIKLTKLFDKVLNKHYFDVNIEIDRTLTCKANSPEDYGMKFLNATKVNKTLRCYIDSDYLCCNIINSHDMSFYGFSVFKTSLNWDISDERVVDLIIKNYYINQNQEKLNQIVQNIFEKRLFLDNQTDKWIKLFNDIR